MPKIMLVEDDNSLREIYEARLAAEGFEIVSAKDGEEALALALKERPDLIIADIMMPKVSGFDMLDILRSTPETKGTKIIMMSALSQAEDKLRAEKLGADKYLVKSQVTLEDVTREAHAMLAGLEAAATATVTSATGSPPTIVTKPANVPSSIPAPVTPPPVATPAPIPVVVPPPPPVAVSKVAPKLAPAKSIPITVASDGDTSQSSAPTASKTADSVAPLSKSAEQLSVPTVTEETTVTEQLDEFIASNPTLSSSPNPPANNNEDVAPTQTADGAAAEKAVKDAVNSLTQAPPAQSSTGSQPTSDDSSNRDYVSNQANNKNNTTAPMVHTRRIEPTPQGAQPPKLEDIMAQEKAVPEQPPAVNSVINPTEAPPKTSNDSDLL